MIPVTGCKKPYKPRLTNSSTNGYLVVEGVIAAGQDSTIINLSRTVNVSSKTVNNPEMGATITVEGDQNVSYTLQADSNGRYVAPPLNLDNTHKYRLHIVTADGKVYESDYETVKITPPIDSLHEDITSNGINLYTDAHNSTNDTRYYRWDYTETYIYKSAIDDPWVYDPTVYFDTLKSVLRTPEQQIHTCYVTINSSSVILNSSAALKQDVIQNNLITFIPKDSEKILYRYSILVKQYALTKEAFEFWTIMKKNTEQIGTIFDVQPSEVSSNIHCTSNPEEPVIGYVSVSSISQKRIYIDRSELPDWPFNPPSCLGITNPICWGKGSPVDPDIVAGNYIPAGPIKPGGCGFPPAPGYDVPAYSYLCVDCRFHLGGKTKKPDFWIDK